MQWITDCFKDLPAADLLQNFWTIYRAQPRIVLLPPEIRPTSCPDLQEALGSDLLFGRSRAGKEETMREKLTGPRGSHLIPATRREPRLRYPARRRWNRWTVVIPLLGVMLLLAGCQSQGSSDDGERRGGLYGGMTGGLSRP